MTAPEFSRSIQVETLGPSPRTIDVEAAEGERAALAQRFAVPEISRLAAEVTLVRNGREVVAKGVLRGAVVQSCVATGEPVSATVETAFELAFRPLPQAGEDEEEVELSEAELDVIFYEGRSIDVGEAVAETLFLNLDPYPRAPTAEAELRAAGVKSEDEARAEANPFSALGALKEKLKG